MNVLESNNEIAHDEADEESGSDEDNFEVQQKSNNFTLRYSAAYAIG